MNIRVTGDRVLIVLPPSQAERDTVSGLFTPVSLPPPVTFGRVWKTGPRVISDIKVGDAVAFDPSSGDALPLGEHQCIFVRDRECLALYRKPVEGAA